MQILVVEDNHDKVAEINAIAKKCDVGIRISHVSNVNDARRKLRQHRYDILIVDLQIPDRAGEDINKDGGNNLLTFLEVDPLILMPAHVIALTAHSETYQRFEEEFDYRGWALVNFIESRQRFEKILETRIRRISTQKKVTSCDVVILTALRKVELDAVLDLECGWEEFSLAQDFARYHRGSILNNKGQYISIVATNCPRMGMPSASATAMKVALGFRPRYVLMTGIAAGIKGKVSLGDVVVADPSWDWGSGKLTFRNGEVVFNADPDQVPLNTGTAAYFQDILNQKLYADDICRKWRGKHAEGGICVHQGPMASGSVVLEDPTTTARILEGHRKTIAIEMEAYGVMSAMQSLGTQAPIPIVMKGICDFADPDKGDDWQQFAAYTSARLAYRAIENHLNFDD